jgi:hypothetical protein
MVHRHSQNSGTHYNKIGNFYIKYRYNTACVRHEGKWGNGNLEAMTTLFRGKGKCVLCEIQTEFVKLSTI